MVTTLSNPAPALPIGPIVTHKVLIKHPAKPGCLPLMVFPYNASRVIRGYLDAEGLAWFVLGDVFNMLGISGGTTGARTRIAQNPNNLSTVRLWVPNVVNPQVSGYRFVQAVRENGMHAMFDASSMSKMRRWMTTTAIPVLRGAMRCYRLSAFGGRQQRRPRAWG